MRVLLASPFFSDHFDSGHYWARALCRLGHQLVLWDWRCDPEPPRCAEYDVALVLKGGSGVAAATKPPRVLYFPDDFGRFPQVRRELPQYGRVFTPVRPTPVGAVWLPGAWCDVVHIPQAEDKALNSIFIGTWTPYKGEVLRNIAPDVIAGNHWHNSHIRRQWPGTRFVPPVYLHQFARALGQARVAVNVHHSRDVGVGRRFFEFIACTFTVSDRVPGIEEILGPDLTRRVTYRTGPEGRELLHYFLAHEQEREELWEEERKAIARYRYTDLAATVLEGLK